MVNREELAWAAGFYDGEGCTYAREAGRRQNRGSGIGMAIQQIDLRPLERFQSAVLGVGNLRGPYQHASAKGRSPMYSWAIYNWRDANAVIGLLWEFLSEPKRQQIRESLAIFRTDPGWGRPTGRPYKGTGPTPLGMPLSGRAKQAELKEPGTEGTGSENVALVVEPQLL
jgi:hypothetical protein